MGALAAFDAAMDFAEDVVDVLAGRKPARRAVAPKAPLRAITAPQIIECLDETGKTIFVVTVGSKRVECSSHAEADHTAAKLTGGRA